MASPTRKRNRIEKEICHDNIGLKDPQCTDPTAIFEPDKTKRLLLREEPKMAKIPQHHVRLIDTTAALFLQNLIASSASKREQNEECVTLNHIRTSISSNPQLKFLKDTLDDIHDKDTKHAKEYIPAKRRNVSSISEAKGKKINVKVGSVIPRSHADNETVGAAVAAAAAGKSKELVPMTELVPDADDYD